MTVLVTGAAGFIGSHLVERILEAGLGVRAMVRYNSRNFRGWLETIPRREEVEIVVGDVRDFDAVNAALLGCQTVFHLAALIGIPYSYLSPLAYVRTNVEGTYNVLEAARRQGTENVLVTSTSETYGSAQYVPIDERHPSVGQSPYSATKIAADQLAISYHRSFGVPVKLVRPFNVYGPRQSARAIIPTIITQLLAGQRRVKMGNPAPTRDLTFVKDTVEGFWAIAGCSSLVGEATNIGMDEEISMGELAALIAGLCNTEIELVTDQQRIRPSPSEVDQLRCKNAKLVAQTGWKPSYDLARGLAETIEWFRRHADLYRQDLYHV